MRHRFTKAMVAALGLIHAGFRILPRKRRVAFISRQSNDCSLDYTLLIEALEGKYPDIDLKLLCTKLSTDRFRLISMVLYTLRELYLFATSRVVVLDGYSICSAVLPHHQDLTVIQIWHASAAVKKFGWQTVGKSSGADQKTAEILKMHSGYDIILAASDATARTYQEAFRANPEIIHRMGLPHLTWLAGVTEKLSPDGARFISGPSNGKQNLLYVPTFRPGKALPLQEIQEVLDLQDYNLYVRLHPLDRLSKLPAQTRAAAGGTTFDWMAAADVIMTDYSSLVVEASLLMKPLLLFQYDIDEYVLDPGLNIDFRLGPLKAFVFSDIRELPALLARPYPMEALADFRSQYLQVDPIACLNECVELIRRCCEKAGIE